VLILPYHTVVYVVVIIGACTVPSTTAHSISDAV